MNGASLALRRTPIPQSLAELGVVVAKDQETGLSQVLFPDAMKEKLNVLMPVSSWQQADPNWTPSVRLVRLDPDANNGPHFYKQQGRLAPTKEALNLLAKTAGISISPATFTLHDRIEVGGVLAEQFTHAVVAAVRLSDGTAHTWSGSKTYEPVPEYEEIRDAVKRARDGMYGKPGDEKFEEEARKRWLNEIKFAKAKNETKAINRALRAIMQVRQGYPQNRAALPFVVVAYNFTPDYDDAEVKAILIQAGLTGTSSAANRLYGAPELAAADVFALGESPDQVVHHGEVEPPDDEGIAGDPIEQETVEPDPAESEFAPEEEVLAELVEMTKDPEPSLEEEPVEDAGELKTPEEVENDPRVVAARAAAKVIIPVGSGKGKTLPQLVERGKVGLSWIEWALGNYDDLNGKPPFKDALWAYCRVFLPDLVAEVEAKKQAAS